MEIVLRKHCGRGSLRLKRATTLTLRSQRLAALLPCSGQWMFCAMVEPGSAPLLYNQRPAPARCPVQVGDLLSLDGLDLVVEAVAAGPGPLPAADHPPACALEVVGGQPVPVTADLWIGVDPSGDLCAGDRPDRHLHTLLLMHAGGRWHLHDLSNRPILRNGSPSPCSVVLEDGDQVRIGVRDLHFRLRRPAATGTPAARSTDAPARRNVPTRVDPPALQETAEVPRPTAPPVDPLYPKALALCQQVIAVLRGEMAALEGGPGAPRGVLGWLGLLRQPRTSEETLDRLHFLLSCSPRDRVWLFELARFLDAQSYPGLCLRILTELWQHHPRDGRLVQALVKCCYRLGRNPVLPSPRRLEVLEQADQGMLRARQLAPHDPVLADLQEAVRRQRASLQGQAASPWQGAQAEPIRSRQ